MSFGYENDKQLQGATWKFMTVCQKKMFFVIDLKSTI